MIYWGVHSKTGNLIHFVCLAVATLPHTKEPAVHANTGLAAQRMCGDQNTVTDDASILLNELNYQCVLKEQRWKQIGQFIYELRSLLTLEPVEMLVVMREVNNNPVLTDYKYAGWGQLLDDFMINQLLDDTKSQFYDEQECKKMCSASPHKPTISVVEGKHSLYKLNYAIQGDHNVHSTSDKDKGCDAIQANNISSPIHVNSVQTVQTVEETAVCHKANEAGKVLPMQSSSCTKPVNDVDDGLISVEEALKQCDILLSDHISCAKPLNAARPVIENLICADESQSQCDVLQSDCFSYPKSIHIIQGVMCDKILAEDQSLPQKMLNTDSQDLIISNNVIGTESSVNTDVVPPTVVKQYMCVTCFTVFAEKSELESHELIHRNDKQHTCDTCGKAFTTKQYLNKHKRRHVAGKPPYLCGSCDQQFDSRKNRHEHKLLCHQNELPYKCGMCPKQYRWDSQLKAHQLIHTNEKRYVCLVCQMKFARKGDLKNHDRIHENEKKHVCEICKKGFNQLSNLLSHRYIHKNERPHNCDTCGKTFRIKSHLTNHMFCHKAYERPHICNICGKGFRRTADLKGHQLSHTQERKHECDICGKKFLSSSHLNKHRHLHAIEKKYACTKCPKKFFHKENLKNHRIKHTHDKPHVCDTCGKWCKRKVSLKYHNSRVNCFDPSQVIIWYVKIWSDPFEIIIGLEVLMFIYMT